MDRPKVTIVCVPDEEYNNNRRWDIVCNGKIVDCYATKQEAREFERVYDPLGWYCIKCDESRPRNGKVRGSRWICSNCGHSNPEDHKKFKREIDKWPAASRSSEASTIS